MPISDLTGTSWCFDSDVRNLTSEITQDVIYNINFIVSKSPASSAVVIANKLKFSIDSTTNYVQVTAIKSDNTEVDLDTTDWWTKDYYYELGTSLSRIIRIVGGDDTANPNLISFLENHASRMDIETSSLVKNFIPSQSNCIYYACENPFILKPAVNIDNKDSFDYYDGTQWQSYSIHYVSGVTNYFTLPALYENGIYVVYIRGIRHSGLSAQNHSYFSNGIRFYTDSTYSVTTYRASKIYLCGNLGNLIDYTNPSYQVTDNYFMWLAFSAGTGYITTLDTYNLILPWSSIPEYGMRGMFQYQGCLTNPPIINATIYNANCCRDMFLLCFSLKTPPAILAITVSESCCRQMFTYCLSLKTLPELASTTLAADCYRIMFSYCVNIKLSETQTGNYTKEFRIPTSGTGTDSATSGLTDMFKNTGGTFTGTPTINTTYYLYEEPQLSVDLTTLSGWSDVSAGSHTLKVKAKATGYRDSALSTGVSFTKAEQYVYEQTGTVLKITSAPYEQSGGTLIL